jgi:hypothetical protein
VVHTRSATTSQRTEENAPLWDEDAAIGVAEEHAESVIATPIPAYAVTATVNLETLEIPLTKS